MVDIFYPLQWIADKLTYEVFKIAPDTHLASSVNFIIYDVLKIFILLDVMIFVVSYIRTYVTPEKNPKNPWRQNRIAISSISLHARSGHTFLFLFISTSFYWFC
ncbi:hypothetical protein [Methanosarcina barkeri]|uniref:hypothetical protein n=1 Tax=Methanosarcina barkeri TaxID=2208 RepID=UPI000A54390F|nr:hypothetical protein [Methanosarcina barkeri]